MPVRKYAPFYKMSVFAYPAYDLRLRKGDVIANIAGKTIMSMDGDDTAEIDEAVKDLQKLGFNLPE